MVRKKINGINLVYVPVFANFRGSIFNRFVFYISFIFSAFAFLLKEAKQADVIWGFNP